VSRWEIENEAGFFEHQTLKYLSCGGQPVRTITVSKWMQFSRSISAGLASRRAHLSTLILEAQQNVMTSRNFF
jgi:hypothetical protein